MKERFRILSIDGGGVRGIYPLRYLAEIRKQVNMPIHKYFDLIVGTSSGGITAIGIGLGYEPEELVGIYTKHAKIIFKKQPFWRNGVFNSIYSVTNLEKVLKEILGDKKLGDAETRLCIPTVELKTGRCKVLKTDHHADLTRDWKMPAWEAACATAAAPVYFETFIAATGQHLIDGGVWAANPALVGICEAVRFFGRPFSEIELLSIGTGEESFQETSNNKFDWGLAQWFVTKKLLSILRSTHSQSVLSMVNYMQLKKFERIDNPLKQKCDLSDLSKIPYLDTLAKERAQETSRKIIEQFLNEATTPYFSNRSKKEEVQNGKM